jgi:hypothetical protein
LLKSPWLWLGAAWAGPLTLAGLLAGACSLPFGARPRWDGAALVFHRFPWGPGGAITLGNVILHTGDSLEVLAPTYACLAYGGDERVCLGDHERAHVYQSMALGLLFPLLYFACGGVSVRNRFEQAADRYAMTGSGWWPWPRGANAAGSSS